MMKTSLSNPNLESEYHAFSRLGLDNPIVTEDELIRQFRGIRVPEALFNDNGTVVSVEVKRIIGNALPIGGGGRRRIRRYVRGKERIIWPWTSSVETALSKLHHNIATEYNVNTHVAVFLVPDTLSCSDVQRVQRHINTIAYSFLSKKWTPTKVKYHILTCDEYFFDRV